MTSLKNKIGIGLVVLGASGFVYGVRDIFNEVNRSHALIDQYQIRRAVSIEKINEKFPEIKACGALDEEYNQITLAPGFEDARQEYNDLGEVNPKVLGGIAVSGVLCIAGTMLGMERKDDEVKLKKKQE